MSYVPESVINEVEELKEIWKFDEAMRIVNSILAQNPKNEEALLQVADIQYRNWEISKATKAIDFLNAQKNNEDPLGLYIKGVLEMEKNHRLDAKNFLKKALELTNWENHEILRCYGLCEYWYGNREKWVELLQESFSMNSKDAEVIFNLIEVYMLEQRFWKAAKMIEYFHKNYEKLETMDKDISYYDHRISLFETYIRINKNMNISVKKKWEKVKKTTNKKK